MKLRLKYQVYSSRQDAKEQYGDSSEENDFAEIEFTDSDALGRKQSNHKFIIDFEPQDGDILYLVKGTYSLGYSFGASTGNTEYLEVFDNKSEADLFAKKIDLFDRLGSNYSHGNISRKERHKVIESYKWILKNNLKEAGRGYNNEPFYSFVNKDKTYHFPWGGYFEILNEVEVVELSYRKE